MRVSLLAALIAATALAPAAAMAQEARGGGLSQRGEWRGMREGSAVERPQPSPQGQRDGGGQAAWRNDPAPRPDAQRPSSFNRPSAGSTQTDFSRPDRDGRPDWRRPDGGARPDRRGRSDGARPAFQRPDRDDRRDWARSGADWRDGVRDRWDSRERMQWNRGWRGDERYDYGRYRAQNRDRYRLPRYYAPRNWGYGYRRFGVGFTMSSMLFAQDYWIDDPLTYRLPPAYGPYRWVRYYNDALLVDVRSGQVVDATYDIFW